MMSQSSDLLRKIQDLKMTMGLSGVLTEYSEEDKKRISVLGLDFVSLCLSVCLDRRASIDQLAVHPFLAQ